MKPNDVKAAIERLLQVLSSLRQQNSGADIHTIGNIRNVASLMIEQLETDPDCVDERLVHSVIKNTEHDLVEFYKKKYPMKESK